MRELRWRSTLSWARPTLVLSVVPIISTAFEMAHHFLIVIFYCHTASEVGARQASVPVNLAVTATPPADAAGVCRAARYR
jgi:hypothetical protein